MQRRQRDLEGKMALDPNNGTVHCVPQLGQLLYVYVDGHIKPCGQVISCGICEDAVTGKQSIRVKTTAFPEGFDVFLATGVVLPVLQ